MEKSWYPVIDVLTCHGCEKKCPYNAISYVNDFNCAAGAAPGWGCFCGG